MFFLLLVSLLLHCDPLTQRSFSQKLWGYPPHSSIYLGMWTLHFKGASECNWKNHAYGVEYEGYFISSMVNTYYQQCYTAGITRDWVQKKVSKNAAFTLGFRFGGIYGYDHKLKSISDFAERYKILPYGQLYTHFIYKRLRLELSTVNRLISLHLALIYKDY